MAEGKMMDKEIITVEKTSPDLVMKQTEQLKHISPLFFSAGNINFETTENQNI